MNLQNFSFTKVSSDSITVPLSVIVLCEHPPGFLAGNWIGQVRKAENHLQQRLSQIIFPIERLPN